MKKPKSNTSGKYTEAKILIVENLDEHWQIIQHMIHQCLTKVNTQRAASAQQTIEWLSAWQQQEWELPKLILLDLHLPTVADGWALLTAIKAMPAPARWIPIVVLSSSKDEEDIAKTYQLGGSSYLLKPTGLAGWQTLFEELTIYWWKTVTLPPIHFKA